MFRQLLQYLTDLLQIEICPSVGLLSVVNCHSVPTAIAGSVDLYSAQLFSPDISLSKLVVESGAVYHDDGHLDAFFARGMQLRSAYIDASQFSEELFRARNFHGLHDLTLDINNTVSLSWLSEFICRHPLSKKITFDFGLYNASNWFVPFIDSFIEKADSEGLGDSLSIQCFAVTRITPAPTARSSDEWYVSGMNLWIPKSATVGKLLHLLHSFFPKIFVLTLELEHESSVPYVRCLILFHQILHPNNNLCRMNLFLHFVAFLHFKQ